MEVFHKVGGRSRARLIRVLWQTSSPWAGSGHQRHLSGDSQNNRSSQVSQAESWDSGQGYDGIDIHQFKASIFETEKPLHMKAGPESLQSHLVLPAISKWFVSELSTKEAELRPDNGKVLSPYLKSFSSALVLPFELAYPQPSQSSGDAVQTFLRYLQSDGVSESAAQLREVIQLENAREVGKEEPEPQERVLRFDASLGLLEAAQNYNVERPEVRLRSLYVAQSLISDLPEELQNDLPVPSIVKLAGKGDIYSSSIWLGLEPTFTPLHRDPNPNLFIQMCSNKVVRLLPPASGDRLYRNVQNMLPQAQRANSRLRGLEMMHGPERDLLRRAVWDDRGLPSASLPESVAAAMQDSSRGMMQEAHMAPGEALFIPKGWWHSVMSKDGNGALNASVNWWFR